VIKFINKWHVSGAMKQIGFPRPRMVEERRIALLPEDITRVIENPDHLYFERGYGSEYDISDEEYERTGANIVNERKASSLEVMCQPKFCERDLRHVVNGQTIFGWLHIAQGDKEEKILKKKSATAIAWELMYDRGKHVFRRNNELTGIIGILHSMAYAGKIPEECRVAVIGRGSVGNGAMKELKRLGVKDIALYHSQNIYRLRTRMDKYDVIVHCACTPKMILGEEHLARMKNNALFVHIGSDSIDGKFGNQSVYSPIDWMNRGKNPIYCVNHIPTLSYKTASRYISEDAAPYINLLIKGEMDKAMENAVVISKGVSLL
jgi:N5-(carboxyethyl)ornithine synthase